MKNYSVNKISNDICQFLVTFDRETFNSFFEIISKELNLKFGEIKSFQKELENVNILKLISSIVSMQVKAISQYQFCKGIKPVLKIVSESDNEVIVTLTQAIYQDEIELKYPKFEEIIPYIRKDYYKFEKGEIIQNILTENGFVEEILVNKGKLVDCDVYIKIHDKEVNIVEVLNDDEFNDLLFADDKSGILHVGQQIKVKNNLLKNGNIIYTISKIVYKKVLSLSDEIVRKINYKNCKTVAEFKDKIYSDLDEVYKFLSVIYAIKRRMCEINHFSISKEFANLYKNSRKAYLMVGYSDELINKKIIEENIEYYIAKEMEQMTDLNTMLEENIIKTKYRIDKLAGEYKEYTYDKYLELYINDLKLYAHIKKQ